MPDGTPGIRNQKCIGGGSLFHHNKRGTVWLGAALDNCCVTKTDDAALNIRLACRNESVDMDRVQIELCERLTRGTCTAVPKIDPITGACYSKSSSSALTQCEINVLSVIPDVQLPGLARRERRQGLFIQKSASWQSMGGGGGDDRPEKIARLQQQIYSDLTAANDDDDDDDVHASVRNLVCIHLPEAARESYAGQLLQVSHFVRIGFHTAATSFLSFFFCLFWPAKEEESSCSHGDSDSHSGSRRPTGNW